MKSFCLCVCMKLVVFQWSVLLISIGQSNVLLLNLISKLTADFHFLILATMHCMTRSGQDKRRTPFKMSPCTNSPFHTTLIHPHLLSLPSLSSLQSPRYHTPRQLKQFTTNVVGTSVLLSSSAADI